MPKAIKTKKSTYKYILVKGKARRIEVVGKVGNYYIVAEGALCRRIEKSAVFANATSAFKSLVPKPGFIISGFHEQAKITKCEYTLENDRLVAKNSRYNEVFTTYKEAKKKLLGKLKLCLNEETRRLHTTNRSIKNIKTKISALQLRTGP